MIVFLDANVLFAAALRDLLMQLAVAGVFAPKWSELIEDEWLRNLLAVRPDLNSASLARTRDLMRIAAPDCLVAPDEALVSSIELPDRDDRHVLAAAMTCKADVLLTFNLRDFPAGCLPEGSPEILHPDAFLRRLAERDGSILLAACETCRSRLRNPALTAAEYVAALVRNGLPITSSYVENHICDE